MSEATIAPTREQLLNDLYEAAELEHNLMCTYLYAAFSLRGGVQDGLSPREANIVSGWRSTILRVAIEEMGHLAAVWNITSALGGSPRFGRGNFPLDPGELPADVVVRLAPFSETVLQHFIYLERPHDSSEPDGEGFAPDFLYTRGVAQPRLTPMGVDYATVGGFYSAVGSNLRAFVSKIGEAAAFCGDPELQLSPAEISLPGAEPVICSKTALAAFKAIVEQGEGATQDTKGSHFQRFVEIRSEYETLLRQNAAFEPAFPAAVNPILRPPVRPSGRVWIEDEEAAKAVDLANASYALMLRLMAFSYMVPRERPEKSLAVDLSMGLMRAVTYLAEHAARLPAGPSNPTCNAGMSFSALVDSASLPPGAATGRFFIERFNELATASAALAASGAERPITASRHLTELAGRAARGFANVSAVFSKSWSVTQEPSTAPLSKSIKTDPQVSTMANGIEQVEGRDLTLIYETKKCIHARFCVTGAPKVFLANVKGPWIHPDAMPVERLVDIAHVCPSGAIRYRRKDAKPNEAAPPVNLLAIRESGPYAVRGDIKLDGQSDGGFRMTLCRCGASKNKPFCDGSHHDAGFSATGEPSAGEMKMLATRNGPLHIEPQMDGPLRIRGNLEITSGTGRVVARTTQTVLCRCGSSSTKPFCDGTHSRIGFRSD